MGAQPTSARSSAGAEDHISGVWSPHQKQELLLGAVLAGSHVRLPPLVCFDPGLCADVAAAIAQCRTSRIAIDPSTVAAMTGINRNLVDELAAAGADVFGLAALDLRLDIERDRNRELIRRAGEMLIAIADEADPSDFDAAREDLVASGLFTVTRIVGQTRPQLLNVRGAV